MSGEVTETSEKPLSICGWLGTIIVAFVPFINVIVLSYWSISSKTDPNRKNFSIAGLITIAIWITIAFALFFTCMLLTILTEGSERSSRLINSTEPVTRSGSQNILYLYLFNFMRFFFIISL